jgi:hypothetical protein
VAVDNAGNVYVVDRGNQRVLFVPFGSQSAEIIAGEACYGDVCYTEPWIRDPIGVSVSILDGVVTTLVADYQDTTVWGRANGSYEWYRLASDGSFLRPARLR